MTPTLTVIILCCVSVLGKDSNTLSGENICSDQELQTTQVNVTYKEAVRIKKHSLCLTPPFLCAEWVPTLQEKRRLENITRTVTVFSCCPGYQETEEGGRCEATCDGGCGHGTCAQPGLCRCEAGFSGPQCGTVGCPRGRWGPDCEAECQCGHGGMCDAVTGACECGPGYLGSNCSERCTPGSWGRDCHEECDCVTGEECHHVTGECAPCSQGRYGDMCRQQCECEEAGTELCSHKDGRCFCKGNWFGRQCDQHCPFGQVNGTCHVSPVSSEAGSECQCPSHLYTCDPELGCVCPPGQDCGIEVINSQVAVLSPYSDLDTDRHNKTAAISLSVLFVAGVAIVLVIIYYKRRMSVMKKDIQNRSVYYCDSEPAGDRTYDLIVRDPERQAQNNSNITATTTTFEASIQNTSTSSELRGAEAGDLVLNNVRLNLDSQNYPEVVKNVNNEAAAWSSKSHEAAFPDDPWFHDVNFYLKDGGDSDKSNLNQRYHQAKVAKADLEVMIRNNLGGEDSKEDDEGDKDSIHNLKMSLSKKNNFS